MKKIKLIEDDYPLVKSHKKRKKKWIIVSSEKHAMKVNFKFDTKEKAKKWLDSWAQEWKDAAEDSQTCLQDPRDFYDIVET